VSEHVNDVAVTEDLLALVKGCAREIAEQEELTLPSEIGPDTPLFGKKGLFDSIGLVGLVVSVEEAIENTYGVAVSLADEKAMSHSKSPFRSIGSLAEYASRLVEEAR
jgi:acyl carrier protein